MKTSRSLVRWLAILTLAQMPAGSLLTALVGADAVVLVNSSSARYLDFKHSIQPYLDIFGVSYTVLDIGSNPVGTNVGDYSVSIVDHSRHDAASRRHERSGRATVTGNTVEPMNTA